MKVKNVKTLRLRANTHARYDRVKQGTYGKASVNGHTDFKGCVIGCLSTPHTKRDLRNFLRSIFEGSGTTGELWNWGWTNEDQRAALKREFGFCRTLCLVLEGIFESQITHGAAIEFIPAFARALTDGSDIKPSELRKHFDDFLRSDCSGEEEYRVITGQKTVERRTNEFLEFLRSKAPAT